MIRAAVIGWPVEHSRSPLIHGYWLRELGIDGSYEKIAVDPAAAADFLASLGQRGLAGCNVTVPLKEIACAVADVIDPSARVVGAANTLWLDNGKLHAANTDGYGFMRHLDSSVPGWRKDRAASVLGAGGAAKAIVHSLLAAGVPEVRLFNRTRERADALAAQLGSRVRVFDWTDRGAMSDNAGLLVNTTTLGMKGAGSPDVDLSGFDSAMVVADIVYVPLETTFLRDARRHRLRTLDGLGMLLHQAAPGFEKWFGQRPHVTGELRDLIVADIERR